jgi:hypothetical protein
LLTPLASTIYVDDFDNPRGALNRIAASWRWVPHDVEGIAGRRDRG